MGSYSRKDAVKSVYSSVMIHGTYFTLLNLKEYQDNEDYEFCSIIVEAINMLSDNLIIPIDTKVDSDSLDLLLESIFATTIKNKPLFMNNLPYYVSESKKRLDMIKSKL